jgi:hypothetical protein
MGKEKKKDPERKIALQAQKAEKAEKKAAKRLLKESLREAAGTAGTHNNNNTDDGLSSTQESLQGHSLSETQRHCNSSNRDKNGIGPSYDDIDSFMEAYRKQNMENTSVVIQVLDDPVQPFPFPPRGNATLTAIPTTGELVLFGGEYNNGVQNMVFDELYRWDPDAKGPVIKDHPSPHTLGMWKRILTPAPRPTPRCSHSCVYHDHGLYVFGGEYATVDKYHHYRDLWKFELKTNTWTELKPKGNGPSARSGHRAIVWRHYMILFGGFFEALQDTRWFQDLYAYDFSSNTWSEFAYSKFAILPPERSAFSFGLCPGNTDVAFVYGGFSKLKATNPSITAETRVHSDCWALHLKHIENGRPPVWERLSRKGEYPSQRSGSGSTTYKDKLLVFGGVQDEECENHKIKSVFYDDLFSFDMDRKRWFKVQLKKIHTSGTRRRRRKENVPLSVHSDRHLDNEINIDEAEKICSKINIDDSSDEEMQDENLDREAPSNGWDLDKLRSNMYAFFDADGKLVYENIPSLSRDIMEGTDKLLDRDNARKDRHEEVMTSPEKGIPQLDARDSPLPRINAHLGEKPNIYFSCFPPKKAIVTTLCTIFYSCSWPYSLCFWWNLGSRGSRSDFGWYALFSSFILLLKMNSLILDYTYRSDCWSFDMHRRDKWVCIWPGSMHKQVWKGFESDDDSYISTDRENNSRADRDDDDDVEDTDLNQYVIIEGDGDSTCTDDEEAKCKAAKKAEKKDKHHLKKALKKEKKEKVKD